MSVALKAFRDRIEEILHKRRVRNASIVSTAELLKPEDREGAHDDMLTQPKVRVDTFKRYNDLPGSPSFRIYFADFPALDSEDDSMVPTKKINVAKLPQEKDSNAKLDQVKDHNTRTHARESSKDTLIPVEEYSDNKQCKKEKGKRFRGIIRSRVYGLLAIKNCYAGSPTVNASGNIPPHHTLEPTHSI